MYLFLTNFFKMSRTESTESRLFGGNDTKIWVTEPIIIIFEKADVKFVVKLIEFDYDTAEDHVLLDIQANAATDLLQTGVNVFKQNEITKPLVAMLRLDSRELLRRTQALRARDVILLEIIKSIETLTWGV